MISLWATAEAGTPQHLAHATHRWCRADSEIMKLTPLFHLNLTKLLTVSDAPAAIGAKQRSKRIIVVFASRYFVSVRSSLIAKAREAERLKHEKCIPSSEYAEVSVVY